MRLAIDDEKVRRKNNHGFKRVPEGEDLQKTGAKPVADEEEEVEDNESSDEEN